MSGPVASRRRASKSNPTNDAAPPAKKAKLSQPSANLRQNGFKSMVNGSPAQKPVAKFSNAKNTRSARVKDATAVVAGGQGGMGDVHMEDTAVQPIELSSGGESSDDDSADEEDEAETEPQTNGAVQSETAQGEEELGDADELSFGDRLRAQEPEPVQESRIVDVDSAFDDLKDGSRDLTSTKPNRTLAPTNASSLGTVLSQALRTNDTELLDSCLRVVDVDTVYATVERLPSPLVGTLLQKLAERLHKKPGRAGILMIWVQWALAAHGGYLASQPQLVKQLTSLNRVLKERASGLQPLLSLKGRLDMLQAQLDLRRRNQRKAADDDEEEAVIYVEGEDDFVSSDEEDEDEDEDSESEVPATKQKRALEDFDDDDDDSSVDQMPTTMEMDEDEDSEEDSEAGGLLDDEAEETDNDVDDDGMSEPMSDDMEDEEGLSESEEESKPARRSTAARAGLKGRR